MFEQLIKEYVEQAAKILDEITDISQEGINNSNLHPFIKAFLNEESKDKILTPKNLLTLTDKSIKLYINYTLRPKWTILTFIFGKKDTIPVETMSRKLNIFYFYNYYISLIVNFINENQSTPVYKTNISELITEANNVILEKLTTNISGIKIKNFFMQLYRLKYGEDTNITLIQSVPFLYIKLFLKDKDNKRGSIINKTSTVTYKTLLEKFNNIQGLKDDTEIEMKTLIKILTGKYYADNIPADKDNKVIIPVSEKSTPAELGKEAEEITVELQSFKDDNDIKSNVFVSSVTKESEVSKEIPSIVINEPSKIEHKKIQHLFNEEELVRIAKKIFRSSRFVMLNKFETIEKIKTWRDASQYLKEIFLKNKIDLYDKDVLNFVNKLNKYFQDIKS